MIKCLGLGHLVIYESRSRLQIYVKITVYHPLDVANHILMDLEAVRNPRLLDWVGMIEDFLDDHLDSPASKVYNLYQR